LVHTFDVLGDHFAFDSVSGALHQTDDAARLLVERYRDAGGKRPSDPEDLKLADHLDRLIARGELFAREPAITEERLYPDGIHIKAMCLNVCHDCNLRCAYCFAGTGDYGGKRSRLSEETGKKAIDFLIARSGPRRHLDIDFFGGEPLMNWPVVKSLVHYAETRGCETGKDLRLTLTTNATLLTDDKIEFIDRHFKNVVLSIDGRKSVHDKLRPYEGFAPSYEQTVSGIRKFVAVRGDREHYLRGTFTSENLDFLEDVKVLSGLSPHISIEPVILPQNHRLAIRREHLPAILQEYERLARWLDEEEENGRTISFFHFNIDLSEGPCVFKRHKGCGAGCEYVAVTPEGDIYPCHQLIGDPALLLGHIEDDRSFNADVSAPFRALLTNPPAGCCDCFAKLLCGGGCAANRLHGGGSITADDLLGCTILRRRTEIALWLYARRKMRRLKAATKEGIV
jgi:uncharacterized protein